MSAPSASIAPPRCVGSLAIDAERAPVDAREGGDHAGAEAVAQLQHRALVEQRVDHAAHVVDALSLLGDQLAQQRLVGRRAAGPRPPAEVGEVALRERHRLGVVGGAQVDHAVGVLHVDRPDLGGVEDAEPAALDHRRAAHADARVLGRDDDVAAAEQGGVAREAVPRGDPHERHEPAQLRRTGRRRGSRARRRSACPRRPGARRRPRRTARPAAAAARRARTAGPSWRGCASPACRPGPCSRRTSRRTAGPRPRRRRRPGRRRACARSAPRGCAAAPARRTAAARTPRSCPRRRGPRGSRAPCGGRARGGAPRRRGALRRGRPRGARAPPADRPARRRALGAGLGLRRGCASPGTSRTSSCPSCTDSPTATAAPPVCSSSPSSTVPPLLLDHAAGLGEDLVLHLHRLEHDEREARRHPLPGGAPEETTTPANGAFRAI